MTHYFIYAIASLVLALLLKLVSMEKPVELDENTFILRYGKTLRTFGLGLPTIFIVFIGIIGLENTPQNKDDFTAQLNIFKIFVDPVDYVYLGSPRPISKQCSITEALRVGKISNFTP